MFFILVIHGCDVKLPFPQLRGVAQVKIFVSLYVINQTLPNHRERAQIKLLWSNFLTSLQYFIIISDYWEIDAF